MTNYSTNYLADHNAIRCAVCSQLTDARIRCGVAACEACKKFFLRNFFKFDKLRCVAVGMASCLSSMEPQTSSSQIGATIAFRMRCTRCRLARCFSVGMRVSDRLVQKRLSSDVLLQTPKAGPSFDSIVKQVTAATNTSWRSSSGTASSVTIVEEDNQVNYRQFQADGSSSSNSELSIVKKDRPGDIVAEGNQQQSPSSSSAVPCEPQSIEIMKNEQILGVVTAAMGRLFNKAEQFPLMNSLAQVNDLQGCWRAVNEHATYSFQSLRSFATQLPGFEELPAKDRCRLLTNALFPAAIPHMLNSQTELWRINKHNMNQLLRFMPEFSFYRDDSRGVKTTLTNWNPSTAEVGLLVALLLYRDHPNLSDRKVVKTVYDQLVAVYQSLSAQQHPNDPEAVEARVRQLSSILNMIFQMSEKRDECYIAFRQRCPHIARSASSLLAPAKHTNNN